MALACILITDTRDASYREAWDDGRGVSSAKFGDLHGSKSPRKIPYALWLDRFSRVGECGHCCDRALSSAFLHHDAWRFMGTCKWGCKSPSMGYNYTVTLLILPLITAPKP